MDQKEKLLKEINEDRKRLLDIQVKITSLDKKMPFWKIFLLPLASSLGIFLLTGLINLSESQRLGIFLIAFIISIVCLTLISRSRMKKEKDYLVSQRMEVQSIIFEKSKRLRDLT
ncbi:MAG: hypothetical protein Q4D88_03550 [Anaerococcus sp.]|nr:hypothetical protein [Anaerococcus sp.]